MDARDERKVLAFPINSARTGELEAIMEAALTRRGRMIAGLESACVSLGDSVEPTVKCLQYRLDYCQRVHKTGEVPGLTAKIAALDAIALLVFNE